MPMRTLLLTAVAGVALTLTGVPARAADKADADHIARLIEQLGSKKFSQREAAARELDKIGAPALDALKKAAESSDTETRRRATSLLNRINERLDTRELLAPTHVHLKYQDTPLAEAVADFAKKSGYSITLNDEQGKLAGRKITLDTGKTTFWQAFDQFCAKAGLVEGTWQPGMPPGFRGRPVPVPPGKPVLPPRGAAAPAPARAVNVVAVAQVAPPAAPPPALPGAPIRRGAPMIPAFPQVNGDQFFLEAGKPQHLPTSYHGAVRIRALPPDTPVFGPPRGQDEILVPLEVRAEPKVRWQYITGVHVQKALDNNDQKLTKVSDEGQNGIGGGGVVVPGGGFGPRPMIMIARPRGWGNNFTVRLKTGDKSSHSLKELQGSVSAQVRTQPAALVTVKDVFSAVNKTVKGKQGTSVTVLEATKEENGDIKLRLRMEVPNDVLTESATPGHKVGRNVPSPAAGVGFAVAAGQGQVQVQIAPAPAGGVGVAQPHHVVMGDFMGTALRDSKGKAIPLTQVGAMKFEANGKGSVREITLTYHPEKEIKGAARFTLSGSRVVGVEVPFTLKDVRLAKE
jgi:hypothetical protein